MNDKPETGSAASMADTRRDGREARPRTWFPGWEKPRFPSLQSTARSSSWTRLRTI